MTATKTAPTREPRLKFVSAEADRQAGSRVTVRITLSLLPPGTRSKKAEKVFVGEATGIGTEILELRLAVQATLAAIEEAIGRSDHFRLVGIKVVPAFDTRVVLVCVRTADEPSLQIVGSVPTTEDIVRAAAAATLDATNRVLGKLWSPAESPRAPNAEATAPQQVVDSP